MRDEYDIKSLKPRINPYSKKTGTAKTENKLSESKTSGTKVKNTKNS